jgi:predicted O-linked N-acetylglucosamine transferase (SPINDLY family)
VAGLIEAHDRRGVEVFGYAYGAADDSALRRRLMAGFDHWRDLHFMSDADIERSIRADRIDVLLDLKGHTRGGRLSALAERPATVQLHFMGYPGTLGFDAIDGLVADEIVIPRGDEVHFHERIFRLPRSYLATDAARRLPARAQRAAHGLPDDALVIGSLNQSYKFTRDIFDAWMEALRSAPRSVLWLFASHPRVAVNLRAEAARLGVAGERLIFATRTPQDAHIARVRCMDLALDTLPYGSHTTGIDALWAGVPMLTCRGPTFAGRVGASLLSAVELPQLIASDPDDYRRRLVGLACAPAILCEYAAHLERRRSMLALWDTRGFADDFERLLACAYDEVVAAR